MSYELDLRAAYAMGWRVKTEVIDGMAGGTIEYWGGDKEERQIYCFNPSTDRNDLAEILKEVERRGLDNAFSDEMLSVWLREGAHEIEMPFWFLTSNPAVICEAACKVLESANEAH